MKVFLTGGTGFLGGHIAALLRSGGDDVVALVRRDAPRLEALGCRLVRADLTDADALAVGMGDCDAVCHVAAYVELGASRRHYAEMRHTNVDGTLAVLDAAQRVGAERIAYVSTSNVFGDTHTMIVDETFTRSPTEPYASAYEQTKTEAHMLVKQRVADGAPVMIAMPGLVVGADDRQLATALLRQAYRGKLPRLALADFGVNICQIEDVARGVVLMLQRGQLGQSYGLGGDNMIYREALARAAELGGHHLPRLRLPTTLIKLAGPLGSLWGPPLGYPPNMSEMARITDNKTYWFDDGKARRELGYTTRPLDDTLRELA